MEIIAEIGFNHDGKIDKAVKLIKEASLAGANFVKFQTFKADDISLPNSEHFKNIKSSEIDLGFHKELLLEANKNKINLLSTPFSPWAIDLLEKLNVSSYKISSMDCTNHFLLSKVAETNKPIFLSTGMANLNEISDTVDLLNKRGVKDLSLLHCISNYPANAEELNLNIIKLLKDLFKKKVGYSDHFPGTFACLAAVFFGAEIIETHFTLDNSLEYGDHSHSVNPKELKKMIFEINLLSTMAGDKASIFNRPDRKNAKFFRRGLYASNNIESNEILDENNVFMTRPVSSMTPNDFSMIKNKKTRTKIKKFQEIHPKHINLSD